MCDIQAEHTIFGRVDDSFMYIYKCKYSVEMFNKLLIQAQQVVISHHICNAKLVPDSVKITRLIIRAGNFNYCIEMSKRSME